jgi:hypothetical protein
MKKYIVKYSILAATCLATFLNPARAPGASYAVGISPYGDPTHRTEDLQSLLVFMLETAAPGDDIAVCDALNQKLVTKFVIPEGTLFRANARARAQRLAPHMASLKQFLAAERSRPTEMANVIALPQFLDFAASQLRRPGEPLRVVLLASPFYMNAENPAFNMDSAFPSDANLTTDQHDSVFGCALRKQALNGVTVHLAHLGAHFLNDYHQERTGRFWALYCKEAGGALCTFCSDAAIAFQRARENIQHPFVDATLDPNDTKIEMRQVMRRAIPAWFGPTNIIQRITETVNVPRVTNEVSFTQPLPPEPNVSSLTTNQAMLPSRPNQHSLPEGPTNAAPLPPASPLTNFPIAPVSRGKVGIGIAWSAPVDCDLYVKPTRAAVELFYRKTVSREGKYYHDYRSANLGMDYEFIELNAPVELARVSCYVNYYAGHAAAVHGTVVLYYEGQSYYGAFQIAAPKGNAGFESSRRDNSKYWTRVDLQKLVADGNHSEPLSPRR